MIGFYDTKIRTSITLSVYGVINPNLVPNVNITGFLIGVVDKDNRTRALSNSFGNLYLEQAPKVIEILSLQNSIPYSRYDDNYTIQIRSDLPIKDSTDGGQIKIEFPDDFYMDVFNGLCKTEDRFSLYAVCSQFYNTYVLNAANKLYDFSTSGSLTFGINNHRNAEYSGLTGSIIVYNYDTRTRAILTRSYGTLSKSYRNFTYDGLQLLVNSGNTYNLEVGSMSDPITIGAVEAMKQRLIATPLYFDGNFAFGDTPVTLVPGSASSTFRLAAPQDMLLKTFYITWSKAGDIVSKFYAPIPKFPVRIVKGTLTRSVVPTNTQYANVGGLSVPLYVTIINPPYAQLDVQITVTNTQASLVTLNTSLLSFGKSNMALYYVITNIGAAFSDPSIDLKFTLSGTDSTSFQLTTSTISIPAKPADPDPAPFAEFIVKQNRRGSVDIYIKSSKLAYIYCATGYQYMPEPTYNMTVGRNLTTSIYSYSKPLYHQGYLDGPLFEGTITINGLTPGTAYTTYCYSMNLNRVPSTTFSKVSYVNMAPQKIGTFTMKVNQALVSQELRDEYIKRLATVMGISSDRVQEKLFCKSEAPVGSEPGSTYLTYYVLPDPLNNDVDISPISLIRQLNKRRTDIQKFVPLLDPGNLLVMKEIKDLPPTFLSRPIMDKRGTDWVTINITTSSCGYVMVSAQQINGTRWLLSTNSSLFFYENQIIQGFYTTDKEYYPFGIQNANGEINTYSRYGGADYLPTTSRRVLKVIEYTNLTLKDRYPTAFQMTLSLNQTNQPEKFTKLQMVDDTTLTWTVNMTGLTDNLIYNFYVSAKSDRPVYADYMNPDYVAQVNLKTIKKRRKV
jgi:hypothetical protein